MSRVSEGDSPRDAKPAHAAPARGPSGFALDARSYEIDPYGHVNNAVYVSWLEHGRLAWLRERGMSYTSIPETFGVHVVVVSLRLDYRAEVVLGDRLVVVTDVVRLGRTSFTLAQSVEFEDGRVAASGEVTMVCTRDGRSAPIPPALRERLGGAGSAAAPAPASGSAGSPEKRP